MAIKAIFFDVGETLVNEESYWEGWAEYLEVPVTEMYNVLRQVIRCGEHHHAMFRHFRGDFIFSEACKERQEKSKGWVLASSDLYSDALSCLKRLRQLGIKTGIAGNQPIETEALLADFGFCADFLASSESWDIEKPSPYFFEKIIDLVNLPPESIAYVGDRLDNDIIPAHNSGMKTIFVKRGPWAAVHAEDPEIVQADLQVGGLMEIIPALKNL